MNYKYLLIAIIIALGLGYYLGMTLNPVTKTEIEEREVIKNNVITVIKEVTRTDGTKESTTTIVDRSKETRESETSIVAKGAVASRRASLSAVSSGLSAIDSYTISYEQRLFGPFWLGANYNTKQVYGLSVGMEF